MPQPSLVVVPCCSGDDVAADLWQTICSDAAVAAASDRVIAQAVERTILRRSGFVEALAHLLGRKLGDSQLDEGSIARMIEEAIGHDPTIAEAAAADLCAIRERDPACPDMLTPFLFFKGFHALQAYRVSHWLWAEGRQHLARLLQSRISEVFAVDIHPAATLGRGILIDHGTSVVIGETAVVEDNVSMLQEVTLGGTGKECGDRHPKIRRGVLIGAGAKVFGNIEVGQGAKIGAGSIVLHAVSPFTTVVGVPAKPVGVRNNDLPGLTMDNSLPEPDYVI